MNSPLLHEKCDLQESSYSLLAGQSISNFPMQSNGPPSDAKIRLQSEHGKEKKCCIDSSHSVTKDSVMERDVTYQITSKAEEIGSGSVSENEGHSTNESRAFHCHYPHKDASQSPEWNATYLNRLVRQIPVIMECDSPSIEKIDNNNPVHDPQISIKNIMRHHLKMKKPVAATRKSHVQGIAQKKNTFILKSLFMKKLECGYLFLFLHCQKVSVKNGQKVFVQMVDLFLKENSVGIRPLEQKKN